ncbi:hypothetical protein C8R47DRAFT_1072454 [Mycena vitilis]|nr:hypothetical protein C8R47DRAFT_1072454 [Mycena vitilis]
MGGSGRPMAARGGTFTVPCYCLNLRASDNQNVKRLMHRTVVLGIALGRSACNPPGVSQSPRPCGNESSDSGDEEPGTELESVANSGDADPPCKQQSVLNPGQGEMVQCPVLKAANRPKNLFKSSGTADWMVRHCGPRGKLSRYCRRFAVAMRGSAATEPQDMIFQGFDWSVLPSNGTIADVVHDFFEPQPVKNAAAFLMRYILHAWADDAYRGLHDYAGFARANPHPPDSPSFSSIPGAMEKTRPDVSDI